VIWWILLIVAVLAVSTVTGMHLRRFREAYTEMTGMMAGMTMGMLNGFLLGFASAATISSLSATTTGFISGGMFWGNLFGIFFGIALGSFFGRPGGLMGIMDGAMGGVMGGAMGAMLAVMLAFPSWALGWTGVLLSAVYIAGMVALVVLIERSAPGHAALHRLAPFFTRAIADEVAEEYDATEEAARVARAAQTARSERRPAKSQPPPVPQKRLVDYYAMLGLPQSAGMDEIQDAYLEKIDNADDAQARRIERALEVLTNPQRRQDYDRQLTLQQRVNQASVASAGPANGQATVKVSSQGGPQPPVSGRPAGAGGSTAGGSHPQPHGSQNGPDRQAQGAQRAQGSKQGKYGRGKQGKPNGQRQGDGRYAQKQSVKYARYQQRRGPGAGLWVGVGAVVLLALVGVWMLGATSTSGQGGVSGGSSSTGGGQSDLQARLEPRAVVAPVGADGKQTLDLVVNGDTRGYKPSVIKVKQGVPVHFNLSMEGADPG
jgi:curved DNA-binding protein CbpA